LRVQTSQLTCKTLYIGRAVYGHSRYRIKCQLQAGQAYGTLKSSDSRQGYVLCIGNTIDEAMTNADTARDAVHVIWDPLKKTTFL
jgi:L-amino acid ligase C-terminal domain 2